MSDDLSFIIGLPRSGTTLLSALLNNSPDVICPSEPWLLFALEQLGDVRDGHLADSNLIRQATKDFFGQFDVDSLKSAAALAIYRKIAKKHGKALFIDKTPRYYHLYENIRVWFPNVPLIILLRNPFAIAASVKTTWNINISSLISSGNLSHCHVLDWVVGVPKLVEITRCARAFTMRYEQLVASPEEWMSRLFRFLQVRPHSEPLRVDCSLLQGKFGDSKIKRSHEVHNGSEHGWKSVLTDDEKLVLGAAIGRDVFESLGYAAEYDSLGVNAEEEREFSQFRLELLRHRRKTEPATPRRASPA
jgi:hypothetical protein